MGTKLKPTPNDCYDKALPDEPRFTLLARDPHFARMIEAWAKDRREDIRCGARPSSDMKQVIEAEKIAAEGADWRRMNNGKWRIKDKPTIEELDVLLNSETPANIQILPDGSIIAVQEA